MYSIKNFLIATSVLALICCGTNNRTVDPAQTTTSTKKDIVKEPISGERINGPANIRDSVNGEVIFSLNDSALISCTRQQNGWYKVGLNMDLTIDEFGINTVKKGRKILVDGKEVGVILKDVMLSCISTKDNKNFGDLVGYTHKDNIYSYSIIENALADYLSKQPKRTLPYMRMFIRNFELEGDSSGKPFATFMNYENWIDDPSPLMRIELIFHDNNLVGAVHSRPLNISNTTDYKLERGFNAVFFNDVDKSLRDSFIKDFNSFINTVD